MKKRGRDDPPRKDDTLKEFEEALAKPASDQYVLCLYVAGATPRSIRAIGNLKRICQDEIPGNYELEVVDIYQHPEAAEENQIFAAPTLVKRLPPPFKKLVGDLSDKGYVLRGLSIRKRTSSG